MVRKSTADRIESGLSIYGRFSTIVFSAGFMFAAIVLIIIGIFSIREQIVNKTVDGVVLNDSVEIPTANGDPVFYNTEVRYTVGDDTITKTFRSDVFHKQNDTVTVSYNPDNPHSSSIDSSSIVIPIVFTTVGVLLMIFVVVWYRAVMNNKTLASIVGLSSIFS